MLDVATCAMAFRILRMNGYNVTAGIFICWNSYPGYIYTTFGHARIIDAFLSRFVQTFEI